MKHDNINGNATNESIAYALGCIETRIAEIARDFNQPESKLREWVGILLLSKRQGSFNNLSALSGNSSKIYPVLEQMEVDEHTHRKTRGADSPRKVGGPNKGFKYNGKHWTQLPKNKARLRKQTAAARAAYLAKRQKAA